MYLQQYGEVTRHNTNSVSPYFQVVLAVVLAIAAASPKPGIIAAPAVTAYAAPAVAAYAAPAVAAYAAPAITTYTAPAVAVRNVPVVSTGYQVAYSVEPVEQHGYKIVY